jgi:hypothetical protein
MHFADDTIAPASNVVNNYGTGTDTQAVAVTAQGERHGKLLRPCLAHHHSTRF